MNNKKKFCIIFGILLLAIFFVIIIRFILLNKNNNVKMSEEFYTNTETNMENNIDKLNFITEANDIIKNNINKDSEDTILTNNATIGENNGMQPSIPTEEENASPENDDSTKNLKQGEQIVSSKEESMQTNSSENIKKENIENETNTMNSTTKIENTNTNNDLEENSDLANTSYTKINKAVINDVVNMLNSEIAKNDEFANSLNKYGIETKAVPTTKDDVTQNTSAFTYMFVKDITKGKVEGNYIIFKERVQNQVKVFGTYYVYAEDEFVYNSKGTKAYWSQTLCYIYNKI